jgi:signal transduction histidine kinase
VENWGGTIAVESEVNKGTTFTVEFPTIENTPLPNPR